MAPTKTTSWAGNSKSVNTNTHLSNASRQTRLAPPTSPSPWGEGWGEGESGFRQFVIRHSSFVISPAFTLIELLVVISIIALLVAVAVPTMNSFRPNLLAVASRQLLDDFSYARQRAISDHTTVYVLFMPSVANWNPPPTPPLALNDQQRLLQEQYVGYTFYVKRQVGDQPGNPTIRYLGGWRTLPQGIVIAQQKFGVPPTVVYGPSYSPALVLGGPANFM